MVFRVRSALLNAAMWTLLVSSAFIGIGGLGLEESSASDLEIRGLWRAGGILAIATFVVTIVILALRAKSNGKQHR